MDTYGYTVWRPYQVFPHSEEREGNVEIRAHSWRSFKGARACSWLMQGLEGGAMRCWFIDG